MSRLNLLGLGLALSAALLLSACATDGAATSQPTAEELKDDLDSGATEVADGAEGAASAGVEDAAQAVAEKPPEVIPAIKVPKSQLDGRRLTATAAEVLNDPGFRERFANSYLADTEIEPSITTVEREALLPILDLISGEQLDAAAEQLVLNRTAESSAVFDFLLGNVYMQQDRLADAATAYQAAIDKHKKFRRAWQGLGQINFREGNSEQALFCFTKVLELGGGDALTYGILGICHDRMENYLASESAFRQASLLEPDSDDWRLGMAQSFLKQGRFNEAVALFDKIIAANPNEADYWLAQGMAYAQMDKRMKAAENFEIVDRLGGSSFDSLNNLGDIYSGKGLYDLAVSAYVRAMKKSPEKGPKRAIRAANYIAGQGALDETDSLVKAIEATHGSSLETAQRTSLLHLRARVAVSREASDEQAAILKQIIDVDPLDGEALMLLGNHEFRMAGRPGLDAERKRDREAQALVYFQRADKIERYEADSKVRQGQIFASQKQYVKAVGALQRAQELKPRDNVQKFLNDVLRMQKGGR